ncbi:hypothetical protein AH04_75 [Erwinia phage AH04]|uniref:Uncharacterized protein n=1 Tax=Erwinia phage AH04 TaxID=2869569 RepID=A0AAE8BQ27_9CAUD|nr:hypothetical protein PQC02_gp239 [Erwinia phage AH04]QZA70558.1 hypothetical protein AH04_75 [Erwinia phage AH04]
MSGIQLVSAKVGLTNYYHNQVVRNPAMDIPTQMIDQLTFENHSGGVKGTTLMHTAVMSGGLSAQPSDHAYIQGGWGESKGLMMMDFTTQDSPAFIEYMHVLGYVSNNASLEGLTMDAIFHPVMSWKTQETVTSNFGDIANPTSIQRKIGQRTDYMYNDGTGGQGLVTLRPSDVIEYGLESASRNSIIDRMDDEGLEGFNPVVNPANASIDRAGVIASKRANTNPVNYASDILKAGVDFQASKLMSGNSLMDAGQSQFDGLFGELNTLGYQAQQSEPQILRDNFFREMMQQLGVQQSRGFNGYSIADLLLGFENLNDVLDLTFMNAEQFTVEDYTLNTEQFGTSSYAEIIASELEANMLDLMLKFGLNIISFKGSNCDNFGGDGGLDNIVILPYNPSSLQQDDFQLGQRCDAFVEALRTQIFTRLNGLNINQMTPIRFNVTAELFGTTVIDVMIVDNNNMGAAFSMEDTNAPVGIVRSFPTFAINTTSPILGTSESAQVAGSNFFSNIESYFQ